MPTLVGIGLLSKSTTIHLQLNHTLVTLLLCRLPYSLDINVANIGSIEYYRGWIHCIKWGFMINNPIDRTSDGVSREGSAYAALYAQDSLSSVWR